MKTNVVQTALFVAAAFVAPIMVSAAPESSAMVLGTDPDAQIETRDNLRETLKTTASQISMIASGLEHVRDDLIVCTDGLARTDGAFQDKVGLRRCLADEAGGARTQLVALGRTMDHAKDRVRSITSSYIEHSEATQQRIAGYKGELETLAQVGQNAIKAGQVIVEYLDAGHDLNRDQKEAMFQAAYDFDRSVSRSEAVEIIISNLSAEKQLYLDASANLEGVADSFASQAKSAYHEAKKQNDYIEILLSVQGVEDIQAMSSAARSDFRDVAEGLGVVQTVVKDLGTFRSQAGTADQPKGNTPWKQQSDDEVIDRFIAAIKQANSEAEG